MSRAKKDLIYLYCVTDKNPKFKEDMLGAYFVYHEGLYAVISKVFEHEFSKENLEKNLSDLEWLKIKVSMHERIVEDVMNGGCVIPFKFATLFNTEDSLKACLDEHGEEFRENLRHMEGKEEWGVKIYCDMDRLSNFLIKGNEVILAMDNEISSSSPGKAFLFKKKRKELIYKTIDRMVGIYIQDSLNSLIKDSLRIRINKLLHGEVTERKEEMTLNAAVLLRKSKVDTFMKTVDLIRRKYEENGLIVDCTGPWPPYNFCGFHKERERKCLIKALVP